MSVPALTWDAMLNITKVEPKLILDAEMYSVFEKAMRGRVSYISKTYSIAKIKYLKSYDLNQNISYTYSRIIFMVMLVWVFFQQMVLIR